MRLTRKFQEGGAMPMDGGMPMDEGMPMEGAPQGGDPVEELVMVAQQALEAQDCEAAMAVCSVVAELGAQQGMGGAPAPAPEEPQFAKQGGRLIRRR